MTSVNRTPTSFVPTWKRRQDEWEALDGAGRCEWFVNAVRDESLPSCLRIKQAVTKFDEYMGRHQFKAEEVSKKVRLIEKNMNAPEGIHGALTVLPWQCFLLAWLYGFYRVDPDTGEEVRAVNELLLVVPRKAGKSSIVAAIMLLELVTPFGRTKSPQVALCGVNDNTADITFSKMRGILSQDVINNRGGFSKHHRLRNLGRTIRCEKNNGKAFPLTLGARNLDGYTLTSLVVDEIAQLPDRSKIETLRSGLGHALSPLLVMTTTPADLFSSAYDDEREAALRWLEGEDERTNFAALMFRAEMEELDDEDGGFAGAGDPGLWERVQPSLGYIVQPLYYENEYRRASGEADLMHKFKTRYLCADSVPQGVWITSEQWERTEDPPEFPEPRPGVRFLMGLDLADVNDTSAICIIAYDTVRDEADVWFEVHAPLKALERGRVGVKREAQMQQWAEDGWLFLHHGGAIDWERFAKRMNLLADYLKPIAIFSDTYSAIADLSHRVDEHIRARITQTPKSAVKLANPMNFLVSLVENGKIRLQKHPVALQHLRNAVIVENKEGGRLPQKVSNHSADRIDSVDALLMACLAYLHSREERYAGDPTAPLVMDDEMFDVPIRLC